MSPSLLLLALALLPATAARAQKPDTPLMGWSSWNTYNVHISDSIIREQATRMKADGFADAGYRYVNIDDGYFGGRAADGTLLIHPTRFPHGLRPVVDHIHALGLKAGIYSDAGRNTCGSYWGKDSIGVGVGLLGHDRQDMDLFFRELDFDFIKVDYCGANAHDNAEGLDLPPRERYTDIAAALRLTGKKGARLNICRWNFPGTWAATLSESWRTTEDIYLGWESVRSILLQNLYLSAYSSPGHYNDMDMLEVGRGLTPEEDRTHFALWCVMNSPLLLGCDITTLTPESRALLLNPELIAVNQDPTLTQAYPVAHSEGCYTLVRDVKRRGGLTRVVALTNPTDQPHDVTLSLRDIDLDQPTRWRDLIARADLSPTPGADSLYHFTLAPHDTHVYQITARRRLTRRRYEAETAYNPSYQELLNPLAHHTGLYTYDPHCSSGMKATNLGLTEDNLLRFTHVEAAASAPHHVAITWQASEPRAFYIRLNNATPRRVETTPHDTAAWHTTTLTLPLKRGLNTLELLNPGGPMPDIDYIEVTR